MNSGLVRNVVKFAFLRFALFMAINEMLSLRASDAIAITCSAFKLKSAVMTWTAGKLRCI